MEAGLVLKLAYKLRERCPVDTGALRASISNVQGNEREWFITIGNEDSSINGTATIQYAAVTNFAKTLRLHGKIFENPNYHWVNKAVNEWVEENKLLLSLDSEEDDDTEVSVE